MLYSCTERSLIPETNDVYWSIEPISDHLDNFEGQSLNKHHERSHSLIISVVIFKEWKTI